MKTNSTRTYPTEERHQRNLQQLDREEVKRINEEYKFNAWVRKKDEINESDYHDY